MSAVNPSTKEADEDEEFVAGIAFVEEQIVLLAVHALGCRQKPDQVHAIQPREQTHAAQHAQHSLVDRQHGFNSEDCAAPPFA